MQHKKLGELFKISSGGTPSKKNNEFYNNGNIPWIKTGDLKTKYIDSASEYITELAVKNSSAKLFPTNTVLIAMYGATIGATSILKIDATTNQACCAFLPNDCIVPEYLYYFFKFNKEKIVQMGVGGAQPNISASILKRIEIPFIDLEKQKKLVNILDKAQELIDKRKEQIEALDELVKSKFIDMFGDPVSNPKEWKFPKIQDVVEDEKNSIKAGPFGSALKKEYYVESGYKIYGQEQVISGDVNFGDYYISEEKYKELENYAVKSNDVLISLVGTYGKILIIPEQFEEGIINPRLMKITFDKTIINTTYFKYFFQSESLRNMLSDNTHGGTMPILNVGIVKNINIPLPKIELQNQFVDFVKEIHKLKLEMERSLKELEDNFNSLMQLAFKGEIFN
jgi:type I restriction enzyme, S subunit